MYEKDQVNLNRDCDAVLVPAGTPILLPKGTQVSIMQALGGTFTIYVNGNLARIKGQDADALGQDVPAQAQPTAVDTNTPITKELVIEQLKRCYDPEIPVNIVDLGLIYEVNLTSAETEFCHVDVIMTLTAPGCGFGPILVEEVKERIEALPRVAEVHVELVFEPPWNQDMMSEAAKLQLNMF